MCDLPSKSGGQVCRIYRTIMEQGYTFIDDQIREKELADIIEKEIVALPPKMREVFLLSRQEEHSYQDL